MLVILRILDETGFLKPYLAYAVLVAAMLTASRISHGADYVEQVMPTHTIWPGNVILYLALHAAVLALYSLEVVLYMKLGLEAWYLSRPMLMSACIALSAVLLFRGFCAWVDKSWFGLRRDR